MEWEGEPCTNHVNEVEVHCVSGKGKMECISSIFCIISMRENVVDPCWDVRGVIDLKQFIPLEEHLAVVMGIVCYY